jgi:signal peptidase I
VWQPALQISGGGYFITTLTKPSVAVPLGFTLFCLLALSLLPPSQPRERQGARLTPAGDSP